MDAVIGIIGEERLWSHSIEAKPEITTALPAVGAGMVAAVLCLVAHVFAPIYATGASILVAVVTGTMVLIDKDTLNVICSVLVGVFLGVIAVLAFYWISARVNLE